MKQVFHLFAAAILLASCGESKDSTNTEATESGAASSVAENTYDGDFQPGKMDAPEGSATGTWGEIVYGSPDAPVEIIEYASLTCPHCATFANSIFPELKAKYIDTGKARLVYRNFVMNRYDLAASTVARCGNEEQTKKLMASFFGRQNQWTRAEDPIAALAALARRAGISRTAFDRCIADTNMHKHLVAMTQHGQELFEINSTPTIIVNGTKQDNYGLEAVSERIEDELN